MVAFRWLLNDWEMILPGRMRNRQEIKRKRYLLIMSPEIGYAMDHFEMNETRRQEILQQKHE